MEDVMAHLEVSSGSAMGAGFAFTADEVEGALAHAQAARGVGPLQCGGLVRPHGQPSHSACQGCLQHMCGYTISCCTVPQHRRTMCADLLA